MLLKKYRESHSVFFLLRQADLDHVPGVGRVQRAVPRVGPDVRVLAWVDINAMRRRILRIRYGGTSAPRVMLGVKKDVAESLTVRL